MVTEGSREERMGVRNYGDQGCQSVVGLRSE